MNDGVALVSVSHPTPPWWKRVWFWLRRPSIDPASLETMEIEIPERPTESRSCHLAR